MALLARLEQGQSNRAGGRLAGLGPDKIKLDDDLKPLAEELRMISQVTGHDRGSKATSIFAKATQVIANQTDTETTHVFYYAEISRQAEAILRVFMDARFAEKPTLRPIVEVVRFFHTTYLSRSALEAIKKLASQHREQSDVYGMREAALKALESNDGVAFQLSLMKLMACGEFQSVI